MISRIMFGSCSMFALTMCPMQNTYTPSRLSHSSGQMSGFKALTISLKIA